MKLVGIGFVVLLAGCHGWAQSDPQLRSNRPVIRVTIDGRPATAWTPAVMKDVPIVEVFSARGQRQPTWRLADVVHTLVGPHAVAVAAIDDEGRRTTITAAQWIDTKRPLVIGIGEKGFFKLERLYPLSDDYEAPPILKGVQEILVAQ